MLEKEIEKYVREHVKGRLLKFVSPGEDGVPDRIHLLPDGRVVFIEFKKQGGRLSERQKLWFIRLWSLNQDVRCISSMEDARAYVEEMEGVEYGPI